MTKQELKEKQEELRKQLEELKAIEAEVNKEESEMEFLRVRETKRMLWNVIEMLLLRNIKMTIAGFTITIKPVSEKPSKELSGVMVEKNKEVEQVSVAKESLIAKVQRLSKLNPDLHVTVSDKKYPKPARNWLLKNFPEALENR